MPKMQDLTGLKFNKLTAIKRVKKPDGLKTIDTFWLCKCDCGNERILPAGKLTHGQKSCGCLKTGKKKIHGLSHTRFYHIFTCIIQRCTNKNHEAYNRYGGRGIKCLWKDFVEFKRDMFESYTKHCKEFGEKQTSIDRIDNDGNYCKENCRWATHKEQANNTKATIKNKKLLEISKKYNIKFDILLKLEKNKIDIETYLKDKRIIYKKWNEIKIKKDILQLYESIPEIFKNKRFFAISDYYLNKNHTLQETGDYFGITRERVRQIINNIIETILQNVN